MNMGDDMEQGKENNAESMIEQLAQAFLELEARKGDSENKLQWLEIKQHFHDLENALKKKVEELEAKEKEYEAKQLELDALLAERKAAVASKEQDLLDRLQELKDAAVVSIVEAHANHQNATLESVYDGENKDNKVSSSLGDANSSEEDFPHKSCEKSDGMTVEVRPHPELTHFCEQMDAKGLLSYIMENKKNLSVIRGEISVALKSATDPARLVLDLLEGFYPTNETIQLKDKMGAALQGMRKSCIIILEAMATLLARADPGADHLLNPETKQQAKAIADEWRPKLARADTDAANGNSLEAEAFLQLISTFRIASEFDEEELCKLVLAVAQLRQAPELCRSIGLIHKMPVVVESLINNGKQIAAVHFIHAFQLQESFAPVPLLKLYLKNRRRNSQVKTGNVRDIASAKNDANAQELAALKTVIKCIEEYKLESDYPLDTLRKRVTQLEKSKADKKRSGDFSKRPQSKRPRPNERYCSLHSSVGSAASTLVLGRQVPPLRAAYAGTPDRYPHSVAITYDYQVPGQAIYTQPTNAPPNYGRYMGTSLHSSHQPYI
ncbi:FRIGIDA-like protein 3 [Abrus precatorius]|uniref:FRIGIDA-like protein n=1 Tax=Abrus precatorius TaxID=3816 RepID=A0A8B8KTX0_ABRPR|nr:FRIGIDA-like protein 3 [Abrus precatorius]XP_027346034.1 FRIGIDA-like protein 3 [Abrus precatorius]XP_027346035.1 FRIGIDA-like protein 3 [Abrus precatorius]XP_027346036.1 FRIGIDA-like protein 3 [Abrus precatorius]